MARCSRSRLASAARLAGALAGTALIVAAGATVGTLTMVALAGRASAAAQGQASAAAPQIRLRHYTIYTYKVHVGVKGGESVTANDDGLYDGDAVQDSSSGSFSLDGTMNPGGSRPSPALFFAPRPPTGGTSSGNADSPATVNGTWSDQGTKLVDAANNVTVPFTCSGAIDTEVRPAQMMISWTRSGASYHFTLDAVQEELYIEGYDGCPNNDSAGWLSGADPELYATRFTIPAADIGRRSFSASVSGPLAVNRIYFTQNCPAGGTCSLAWQGVVSFTRVKAMKAVSLG